MRGSRRQSPSCVAATPVRADLLKDVKKGINIAETTANSGSRPRIKADSPARPAGPLPVADRPPPRSARARAPPVPKQDADRAFEAAACIGCGACVAACPNASAMLFTSAKVTHLGLLPQGKPENYKRVVNMLNQMDEEGFGSCSNIGECAEVCPKQIPLDVIANLNRQLGKAAFKGV